MVEWVLIEAIQARTDNDKRIVEKMDVFVFIIYFKSRHNAGFSYALRSLPSVEVPFGHLNSFLYYIAAVP